MNIKNLFRVMSLILGLTFFAPAQNPKPTASPGVVGEVTVTATKANIDPVYTEFRKLTESPNAFSGEYGSVNNFVLKRDAATFTLRSGEIYFLTPRREKRPARSLSATAKCRSHRRLMRKRKCSNSLLTRRSLKNNFLS